MKILTLAFFTFFSIKTITADDVIDKSELDKLYDSQAYYKMIGITGIYTAEGDGLKGDCPNPLTVFVDRSDLSFIEVNFEGKGYSFVWVRHGNDLCIRLDNDAVDFPFPWSKFCTIDRIAIAYDYNEEQKGAYSYCEDESTKEFYNEDEPYID